MFFRQTSPLFHNWLAERFNLGDAWIVNVRYKDTSIYNAIITWIGKFCKFIYKKKKMFSRLFFIRCLCTQKFYLFNVTIFFLLLLVLFLCLLKIVYYCLMVFKMYLLYSWVLYIYGFVTLLPRFVLSIYNAIITWIGKFCKFIYKKKKMFSRLFFIS
jgi:hypothetical protein